MDSLNISPIKQGHFCQSLTPQGQELSSFSLCPSFSTKASRPPPTLHRPFLHRLSDGPSLDFDSFVVGRLRQRVIVTNVEIGMKI